jgi:hypothetical protein
MERVLLLTALAALTPASQGASSQRNEPKATSVNGTSVPNLLRGVPGVVPRSVDMTQHVLTQSGNMLVLTTPAKETPTTERLQYHLPKRPRSIREEILANSNSDETKIKAQKHKLHVPRHEKLKMAKKPASAPTKVATTPKKDVQAPPPPPPPQEEAKPKMGLLTEETKTSMSLSSFYAKEDEKDSEKSQWRFAAHFMPEAHAPAVHGTSQRKVAALLDRQAQTTSTRWQATLAETQREVQEARQDNRIAISDQFSGLERSDKDIEQEQKREDRAARVDAAADAPVFDAKYHSNQVHLSKAFSALEQQDRAIDQYMNKAGDNADLSKIRSFQDESMNSISAQLKRVDEHPEEGHLPPLPVGRTFLETPIHDQWASFEKSDGQEIKDIKRDPNLRAFIQRGVSSRHH